MAALRSIPRGRYAPPLAERQERDRARIAQAGIELVEQHAPLTAEAISRQAGMSKATFYELYENVEDFMPDLLGVMYAESCADDPASRVVAAAAHAGVALSEKRAAKIARALRLDGEVG